MIVTINRDLLAELVGYAESRAQDLDGIAQGLICETLDDVALSTRDKEAMAHARKARRAVELARRILEGR